MSDIELAITRTKVLEALLETGLGAAGRGLHEKVTSVQDRLPPALVKQLRFVATLRNKLVHEAAYQRLDDRPGYERACAAAEQGLRALLAPPTVINKGCFGLLVVGAAAALGAVWRLV